MTSLTDHGRMLGWPAERIGEVAAFYGPLMREAPEGLGGGLLLARGLQGGPMVFVLAGWTGTNARGEAHLAPLRLLGPVVDAVGPLPPARPAPDPAANLETGFLTALPSGDLDLPAPPPGASVFFRPLGPRSAPWSWQAGGPGRAASRWAAGVRRALASWAVAPEGLPSVP